MRKAEGHMLPTEQGGALARGAMKPQLGRVMGPAHHLDLLPAHGLVPHDGLGAWAVKSHAQCFSSGFLGGPAGGQRGCSSAAVPQLLGCENAPEEAIPPARCRMFDPVNVDQIDPMIEHRVLNQHGDEFFAWHAATNAPVDKAVRLDLLRII